MDIEYLGYGILFTVLSYGMYKFHKWYLNDVEGSEVISESSIRFRTFKHWTIIIFLIVGAFLNFFKAIF